MQAKGLVYCVNVKARGEWKILRQVSTDMSSDEPLIN